MRFKSITIENVFSYYGVKHFNFENKDKSVFLIIGENGFGKTSFINSVKIALHGISKDVLSIGNQTLNKEDFIMGNTDKNFSGILNRNAKKEGLNESKITVSIDADEVYIVERTFSFRKNSYVENLELYDENHSLIAQGDEAQDIINQKISPTMARFFFFDGEKIQTIADFSHEEFTKMLEDVLELDIYDQITKDSEYLIRKIKKAELDKDLQDKVEQKEKDYDVLLEKIAATKAELQHAKKKVLKEMEIEKRAIDNKLKKLKSRFQAPLKDGEKALFNAIENRNKLTEKMKTVTLVQLPLLLNNTLRKKVEKDINDNYSGKMQVDPKILEIKKEQLLRLLDDNENKDSVSKAFDTVFHSDSQELSVLFADPHKLESQFEALPHVDFKALLDSLSESSQSIKGLKKEIEMLHHKMADDSKVYKEDFILAKKIDENIIRQKVKCETLEQTILSLEEEEKNLKRDIGKLTILDHKNDLANEKVKALNGVINVSRKMKKKIKLDKRSKLEDSINKKFKLLKKDGYEADKIVLDENFNIDLFDINGNAMDILSSSSGQKQIIATALIWGISEYISEDIPMIIDTPLGRLDEKNQSLILNKFYPEVSKQVIILPTPSELKHDGFKNLTQHVAQTFILSNRGSSTSVEEVNADHIINNKPIQQTMELI